MPEADGSEKLKVFISYSRRDVTFAGVCTLVIIFTVSGLKMRTPSSSPRLSNILA